MRSIGVSCLPQDLLDLVEKLQYSLIQEYFGFVSDEIDDVLKQGTSPRAQLLALRDIVRKLGVAAPILANSTCADIDRVEEAIAVYLQTTFDA